MPVHWMIILHSIEIVTPICTLVSCPETQDSDQYTQIDRLLAKQVSKRPENGYYQ